MNKDEDIIASSGNGITKEELEAIREYFDTHDTSFEMEDGKWEGMPPSVVRHYVENLPGLGDSYDDYRIDDAAWLISNIFDLLVTKSSIDIKDFNKIVDDKVGEMYDERYWNGNY